MKRTASFADLSRDQRLARAEELDRSTPRSIWEVAQNFGHCFVVCFVLDMLFARRMKQRWYALHALVNMVVVTNAFPDLLKTIADPINSMQGRCSVVPPTLIASLFMYHLGTFSNVPTDEWYHHIVFGGGIATWGIYYCPGPLQVRRRG
jgi:hypothetical protein